MLAIPPPELQIDFASLMTEFRRQYLQDALIETVQSLSIPAIDKELARYVPSRSLSALAAQGLRGELMFPVPVLLTTSPRLLGYYRLLYGYSQKQFYTKSTGLTSFKCMEVSGRLSQPVIRQLDDLCAAMGKAGDLLVEGIGAARISPDLLDRLAILTLGPQLRGGANVRRGTAGIQAVFILIREVVTNSVVQMSEKRIEIKNAAGRRVLIEFASDPDIVIREELRPGVYRQIIAIEVKGGQDFSNVHNRIGEAEKSHQKARSAGFVECWTVVNVDRTNFGTAQRESPSTNRFYRLSDLVSGSGDDHRDFHDRIISLTGIQSDWPR
jgi:DNA-binding transcriptional regulator YdaS (Cro superfamily)